MRRFAVTLGAGLGLAGNLSAELALTHLHPAGWQIGQAVSVKLVGKFEPWPCRVWADDPGIVFEAGKEVGEFRVTVGAGVKPGPHHVRVHDGSGASLPVAVAVEVSPQTLEVEPNDAAPQEIGGAVAVINGRLDKNGDSDAFRFRLAAGRTLTARVEANVLAAGFDAMLTLADGGGQVLAFNHDHVGMDPFLVFTAPADGDYVIRVAGHKYPASTELSFAGGADCLYRLHMSDGPVVRHTWPLMVPEGERRRIGVVGWNLVSDGLEVGPEVAAAVPLRWSDHAELLEEDAAELLAVPCGVSGRLTQSGEEDRYRFAAAKGDVRIFRLEGPSWGSLLDPVLRILDGEGKELASADDDGASREARQVWTAPSDGTFTAVVRDLTWQGGPDYYYRLEMKAPAASVSAVTAAHAVRLDAGKSAEWKVTVSLEHGYSRKLVLAAQGLPGGVSAPEVVVPEKGGEVVLVLQAAADAPAASGPVTLVLREVEGGREIPVRHILVSTAENNGVPNGFSQLLINDTDQLWLTVVPPPPAAAPGAAPAAEAKTP
jgi:hypothetical protein